MTLTEEQQNEVKNRVIEQFGIEMVERLDKLFMEFAVMRCGSKDAIDFLEKVRAKYPDNAELLIAALLYGMRQGELDREYAYRLEQQNKTPSYGHAS